MNPRIKVIKHGAQSAKEPEVDRLEQASRQSTREIASTIKLWLSEFKERRRTEEQHSRSTYRLTVTVGSLLLVLFLGSWSTGRGQQLRDAFQKVKQAVVIIRTQQKELAPSTQRGMVSANGLRIRSSHFKRWKDTDRSASG